MNHTILRRLSPLALLVAFACSSTPPPAPKNPWEKDPVFVSMDAIDVTKALDPPPARGSDLERVDLLTLHGLQDTRTLNQCAQAKKEEYPRLADFFGPPKGPLSAAQVKRLQDLVETTGYDTDYFVRAAKTHFARLRPYEIDPTIVPCIPKHESNSYPSGHTAISHVYAWVLGQALPAKKAAFLKRAQQITENRMIGGVHFPTDIVAGGRLSDLVIAELKKSEKFQAALAEAKKLPAQKAARTKTKAKPTEEPTFR